MRRLIQTRLISTLLVIVFAERLPNSLVPTKYEVEIITNLADENDSFTFNGSVSIRMKCISSTDKIILHSKDLIINRQKTVLKALNSTNDNLTISGMYRNGENDFLTLEISQALEVDFHYELSLHFLGDLDVEKVGYYRSAYLSDLGETKWMGVTYFKPNNARRTFPCFDEPRFKANFTIKLGRSQKYRSVSNMPLLNTTEMKGAPNWELDVFQTTPPMSTYALGFAICDFPRKTQSLPVFGVDFSVVSRKNDLVEHTARLCGWFLLLFEKNFKKPYPLPKLDLVAIPNYAVPAMEGWGLVILEEDYLEQHDSQTLTITMKILAHLMADQMIHQWLGNLVSITSWSDMLLIEGVSRYLSAVAVDEYLAGWDSLHSEVTDSIIEVINFDSLQNSHAISIPSKQFDSVGTIDDTKFSKKAFLLIRMMAHLLDLPNLYEAIQTYVEKYEYSNAGCDELLSLINSASLPRDINMKTVMKTWIYQAGLPLITITRNYNRGTLQVKQESFLRDHKLLSADTTRWWIPLTYTTECELAFNQTAAKKWLSPDMDSMTMDGPLSPTDWIIFNLDASSPYIVNYDEKNWKLLIDFLKKPFFEQIPSLNRVLLIESAASMAWVGQLDYKIFFDMLDYLKREKDFHPWNAALHCVNQLNVILTKMAVHEKFVEYVRKILTEFLKDYGVLFLRTNIKEEFLITANNERSANTDVLSSIVDVFQKTFFCVTIRQSTKVHWDHSWNRYKEAKHTSIKENLLRTLTCTKNQSMLWMYLSRSVDDTYVKKEETATIITAVAKNKGSFDLISGFLSANIEIIHDRVSPDFHKLSAIVFKIAQYIVREHELVWLQNFIKLNQKYFRNVEDEVNDALEIAKLNVQWRIKNYETIENYLEEYANRDDGDE